MCTTIFCRKKQKNEKQMKKTTTRKTQKRKIRFSFKQGCDFIVFESLLQVLKSKKNTFVHL